MVATLPEQGKRDLNPQPAVLETAALPIELLPYTVGCPREGIGQPRSNDHERLVYASFSPRSNRHTSAHSKRLADVVSN